MSASSVSASSGKIVGVALHDTKKGELVIAQIFGGAEAFVGEVKDYVYMDEVAPVPLKVYHTSKADDWATPQTFFDVVELLFGPFELDAAASEQNTKCGAWLGPDLGIDALTVEWWGRVWVNPPYSQVAQFIDKAIEETEAGHTTQIVMLVAARTDTKWFWKAARYAAEVRFLKGRLQFGSPMVWKTEFDLISLKATAKVINSAPFPSALLIFDKARKEQLVKWWNWKQDDIADYEYESHAEILVAQTLQDLPPEIKKTFEQMAPILEQFYKIKQQYLIAPPAELPVKEIKAIPGFEGSPKIQAMNEQAKQTALAQQQQLMDLYDLLNQG